MSKEKQREPAEWRSGVSHSGLVEIFRSRGACARILFAADEADEVINAIREGHKQATTQPRFTEDDLNAIAEAIGLEMEDEEELRELRKPRERLFTIEQLEALNNFLDLHLTGPQVEAALTLWTKV